MNGIRIIFSFLVLIHALIHIVGVSKGQIPDSENTTLKTILSTILDIKSLLWLVSSIGLIFSIVFYFLEKRWWWKVAIGPVVLSQILIILYWNEAKFGTIINVIIVGGIVLSYYDWNFNRMVKEEIQDLLGSREEEKVSLVTLESTERLPIIVQKWLKRSKAIGKEKMRTVYLKQKGRMRSTPGATWMSFTGEQSFTTSIPGFIWKASIDARNFITIAGRDKYMNGRGNMLIKAMNFIPIANSSGKEIDQGTALRYLAEMAWFPSAALNDYVTWEPVNETSAKATMHYGDMTVSGIFSFDADGDIVGFEGKRYHDLNGKYSLQMWYVRMMGYKEFHGIRIPNRCEVTWKLNTGDFTWLELEITDVDYNLESLKTF